MSLRNFVLPTTTASYKLDDVRYRQEHSPAIAALREELQAVISHIRDARSWISKELVPVSGLQQKETDPSTPEIKAMRPIPSRQSTQYWMSDQEIDDIRTLPANPNIYGLCKKIEQVNQLKAYAVDLEKSIQKYEHLVETQATADRTGYRELRDWASDLMKRLESWITLLISISTIGAGLTYATIFSASRGNIDLMGLTFPLFTVGFLLPISVQIGLRWAANLPSIVPFASQMLWTMVICAFMLFATAAVFAALIVLNVTVFLLDPQSPQIDGAVDSTNFRIVSLSGIVTFAVLGSAFLIFACAIILAMAASSKGRQGMLRSVKRRHSALHDYLSRLLV